jgi:hypothetical protein
VCHQGISLSTGNAGRIRWSTIELGVLPSVPSDRETASFELPKVANLPSGMRYERLGRLKGGFESDVFDSAEDGGTGPWDLNADKDEEFTYEMPPNVTLELPKRAQRLGPMQMSWGLADKDITDNSWREELTDQPQADRIFQRLLDGDHFLGPNRGRTNKNRALPYESGPDPKPETRNLKSETLNSKS